MSKKEKLYRTLTMKIQNSLLEDFTETCEREYKTKSEVLRDFMLKYIKEHKND